MQRRFPPLTLFFLFCVLLIVSVPAAPARAQGPTGPDFSTVNDMLQGRRKLFPSDDLIVTINDSSAGTTTTTLLQTNNDAVTAQFPNAVNNNPETSYFLNATARMFDLPRDVMVTLLPGQTVLTDREGNFNQTFNNNQSSFQPLVGITANDFTGDGYADLAFVNSPSVTSQTLNVMTAVNVNDLSQGFFYGTPFTLPNPLQALNGPAAVASGDFDGDGANEIALYYQNLGGYVAIFRPQVTTNAQGTVTAITLLEIGSTAAGAFPTQAVALNAGHYNGLPNSALALAYQIPGSGSTNEVAIQPIGVSATSDPNQLSFTLPDGIALEQDAEIFSATSGYLDFFSADEQMVLLVQGNTEGKLNILTFDDNLNPTVASTLTVPAGFQNYNGTFLGVALGNFDQPGTDNNPVTLEIAIPYPNQPSSCSGGYSAYVQMYHVNLTNFALTPANTAQLETCYQSIYNSMSLVTGDTQGRSLVLGPPTKLTATKHKQPQIILDAPPMHVDYVIPANQNQPVVLNLSAVPDGFYASYQTAVTQQAQSSRTSATSYTNGVKVSGSFGVKIGDPLVGSVSARVGASSGFMHKKFVEQQYGQYSSTQFDASTTTGFDDQVWFDEENHNIYIYPVIGQAACPSDIPNCNPNEQVPLVVMFSGPSSQSQASVGGSALEWYQPVHEIGNLFSYPWNFQQLQAAQDNINLLTSQDPTSFQTDSSTTKVSASWSGQNNSSVTSGSVTNISWGASASITEKAGVFGGIVGSQDFSYNGSKAVNTLNTQTTKLGQSTGIGISKPGSFPIPGEYRYSIFPYIFGNNPVSGTVQTINLGTTIQTNGILRAAFTADPTTLDAGAWWTGGQSYPYPDVAVAHPNRWSIQVYTPSAPKPNCIPITSTVRNNDCLVFNSPSSDIWTSEFYWMKGLLITPANANGQGPQISQAAAGDEIQLQARVYNNSLTDMPQGSQIVVQFYGQTWDPTVKKPIGDAFLINTVNAPPLPGFNSASSNGAAPNWSLVSATFDTTNYASQNLGFWVVVFIEEQGTLGEEMPAHGLTNIPGTLAQAIQGLEPYSNNVGFYKQLFYVAPPNAGASVELARAGVKISHVKASAKKVLLGNKITVGGNVRAFAPTDGLSILFKDRLHGGRKQVFDVEQISHIEPGSPHLVQTVYHATTCGTHTLSMKAMGIQAHGKTVIDVTIKPNGYIRRVQTVLGTVNLDSDALMRLLVQAKHSFRSGDTAGGLETLQDFQSRILAKRGQKIPVDQADTMLSILDEIFTCVK